MNESTNLQTASEKKFKYQRPVVVDKTLSLSARGNSDGYYSDLTKEEREAMELHGDGGEE